MGKENDKKKEPSLPEALGIATEREAVLKVISDNIASNSDKISDILEGLNKQEELSDSEKLFLAFQLGRSIEGSECIVHCMDFIASGSPIVRMLGEIGSMTQQKRPVKKAPIRTGTSTDGMEVG